MGRFIRELFGMRNGQGGPELSTESVLEHTARIPVR
jgi:hypothetical protein